MQLVEVARLPHRPSDLLGMRDDGWSPEARLALDVAFVSYALRFEQERDATVDALVPAPKRAPKGKVWSRVPKHERARLLAMLGVDPEDAAGGEAAAPFAPDPAAWAADFGGLDEGEG